MPPAQGRGPRHRQPRHGEPASCEGSDTQDCGPAPPPGLQPRSQRSERGFHVSSPGNVRDLCVQVRGGLWRCSPGKPTPRVSRWRPVVAWAHSSPQCPSWFRGLVLGGQARAVCWVQIPRCLAPTCHPAASSCPRVLGHRGCVLGSDLQFRRDALLLGRAPAPCLVQPALACLPSTLVVSRGTQVEKCFVGEVTAVLARGRPAGPGAALCPPAESVRPLPSCLPCLGSPSGPGVLLGPQRCRPPRPSPRLGRGPLLTFVLWEGRFGRSGGDAAFQADRSFPLLG